MDFKQRLGNKIRYLRKQHNFSQEHFSELIDINPRQIVRIENGENIPSIENLEKMAKVFDISVEEFFINSVFDDEELLRNKIIEKLPYITGEKLRTLYLVVSNL